MRINRSYVPVWKTAQHGRLARSPERPVKPVVDRCNDSREPRPLDWDQAVRAAKARLNEQCVLPDTMDHPLVADQVAWLAGLLCAYGKLADEVDRMEARADATPISKLPRRKQRWIMLAGKPLSPGRRRYAALG
jgi:hypothetical protein